MAKRSSDPSSTDIDMTPMIDMTFQLITFFMFVMNFSEAEQDERIQLPASQLAKPVNVPMDTPITLQLMQGGSVIYAGEVVELQDVAGYLDREKAVIQQSGKEPKTATVIVRADGAAKTGEVQEVIKICQEKGFERFALRAKYDEGR